MRGLVIICNTTIHSSKKPSKFQSRLGGQKGCRAAWHSILHTCWLAIHPKATRCSYFVGSGYKRKPVDEKDRRIQELEAELRETRRANDILKEALGFFGSYTDHHWWVCIQWQLWSSMYADDSCSKRSKVSIHRLRRIMFKMWLIHERKRRAKDLTKATTEIQEKEKPDSTGFLHR